MKNYIQPGDNLTVTAPSGGVESGDLVKIGVLVGVAVHDAAQSTPVEIATRGVFELPKTQAQAWTEGAALYMIPSTGLVTTATTAGNVLIGVAARAAVNPSDTGFVRLNGAAPAAVTS